MHQISWIQPSRLPSQVVLWDVPQRSYAVHWPAKAGGLSTAQADRAMQELTDNVPWRELTNRAGVVSRHTAWYAQPPQPTRQE